MNFDPPATFFSGLKRLHLDLSDETLERLEGYLVALHEINQVMNLTAVKDPQEAWIRHVLDSLTLLPHLPAAEERLMDVGSGGGLPAIPVVICRPELEVTLLDSTGKKCRFLTAVIEGLNLNARVIQNRAETIGQDSVHRAAYDVVTARAVAPLRVLLELTLPLTRVSGRVLAMKGRKALEELAESRRALDALGGGAVAVHDNPIEAESKLVEITKERNTPRGYPRLPGVPKKEPL